MGSPAFRAEGCGVISWDDSVIALSSNSVSVQQGSTSSALGVSLNPINGFTGNVQVALSGLPAGVRSNPASPFNVAAGSSTSVVFGAAANAATGNFTVFAQGTNGTLSHSANLALTVQNGGASALPRTTYARTDATSTADAPSVNPIIATSSTISPTSTSSSPTAR